MNELDLFPSAINRDIQLERVQTIVEPHPFCVGVTHVAYAADKCSGILSTRAIKLSGAPCVTCRELVGQGRQARILDVNEHVSNKVLFLKIESKGRELKDVPGLEKYLLAIKQILLENNFAGVAFLKD